MRSLLVGIGALLLGAAAAYVLGPPLRRVHTVRLPPEFPRLDQSVIAGPRWPHSPGGPDELCFDRVAPLAFEISGEPDAIVPALDAYMVLLARQQAESPRTALMSPYVVEKEMRENEVLLVVRPRSSADDPRAALRVAAALGAHMESLGFLSLPRFPCTVRVEKEDIPRFIHEFETAIADLGQAAVESPRDAGDYTWGYEVRAQTSELMGLFFATLSGNESAFDVVYFDLTHPFDWWKSEPWLVALLSKLSGAQAVLRTTWIDPHVVVVGGRSSGGPCGR